MAARRPRSVLPLVLFVALGAACGSGGNGRHATPTSIASRTAHPTVASATVTTALTAHPRTTLIAYLRGGDLWIGSPDGTTVPPRAITSGAIHSGLSGLVRRQDGNTDVYYIVQLTAPDAQSSTYDADFALYRVPLEGGTPEEVLSYQSKPLEPFITPNASVSPDGKTVLYADKDGIGVLELSSGERKQLLSNSPPCTGPANCFAYHHPTWSPDGKQAIVIRTLWEGAKDDVIDPFASPVIETETGGGGSITARWSPDGKKVCDSQYSYASAGAVMVYDVASGATTDATLGLGLPTPAEQFGLRIDASGCAWAVDGRLAFSYRVPGEPNRRIAIVDGAYTVLAASEPIANLGGVVAWLPDGAGVYFNRVTDQGATLQSGIFQLDGVSDVPFPADTILAVIPPTP
jgi:hypothetical protein